LSVVRHLRQILPGEDVVYFGDTARIPYGTKSRPTVVQFAVETAGFLLRFEPKLIVAACNTASALALDMLERELPVPVIGVVERGRGRRCGWRRGAAGCHWHRGDDRQRGLPEGHTRAGAGAACDCPGLPAFVPAGPRRAPTTQTRSCSLPCRLTWDRCAP